MLLTDTTAIYLRFATTSPRTVFISLFFYGILQFSSGFFSYVVVMADNGFHLAELLGVRRAWTSPAITDLEDSYGQEWVSE